MPKWWPRLRQAAAHATEYLLMAAVGADGAASASGWRTVSTSSSPSVPDADRGNGSGSFTSLLYNKYYVDQIYDAMFVNRMKDLALTLGAFDAA